MEAFLWRSVAAEKKTSRLHTFSKAIASSTDSRRGVLSESSGFQILDRVSKTSECARLPPSAAMSVFAALRARSLLSLPCLNAE